MVWSTVCQWGSPPRGQHQYLDDGRAEWEGEGELPADLWLEQSNPSIPTGPPTVLGWFRAESNHQKTHGGKVGPASTQ